MMSPIFMSFVILLSKADSVCIDTSFFTQDDVHLVNSLSDVTSASSILDCGAKCSSNSACLSFAFEPASGTCHQHVQNSATGTSEMKETKTWLHSNIVLWSKTFLGSYSDHNCKKGANVPVSVKAKVSPRPGYCPVPADIPNANISLGRQQEGSVRTYTCNHGYLDTSLDSTTAVTTCMTDGEWSKVQLNCSGPYIRMETPSVKTYTEQAFIPIPSPMFHVISAESSTLIFLVRTCTDSQFMLSGSSFDSTISNYHIVIGAWNNTKSAIRKCFKCRNEDELQERDLLSCEEFRPFWLSWKKGTISVGKGRKPGDQTFMEWRPRRPALSAVHNGSIGTFTYNKGTWLFKRQM